MLLHPGQLSKLQQYTLFPLIVEKNLTTVYTLLNIILFATGQLAIDH